MCYKFLASFKMLIIVVTVLQYVLDLVHDSEKKITNYNANLKRLN